MRKLLSQSGKLFLGQGCRTLPGSLTHIAEINLASFRRGRVQNLNHLILSKIDIGASAPEILGRDTVGLGITGYDFKGLACWTAMDRNTFDSDGHRHLIMECALVFIDREVFLLREP